MFKCGRMRMEQKLGTSFSLPFFYMCLVLKWWNIFILGLLFMKMDYMYIQKPQRDSVVADRTWTLSHDTHTLRSIPLIFYICTPPTSNYCDRAQSVPTRKYKMCTRVLKTNTYPWLCVVPILTIKSLIFCTQNQENWWKIGKFDDHGKFEFFTFWNRSVPLARS